MVVASQDEVSFCLNCHWFQTNLNRKKVHYSGSACATSVPFRYSSISLNSAGANVPYA